MNIKEIISNIKPINDEAIKNATIRQESLLKPKGSLGGLEDIYIKIAGITGKLDNKADKRALFVFGADNGVYAEGVSGTPQYFTRSLMLGYADGSGFAIDTICKACNVELVLVDLGIIGGAEHENVHDKNLMKSGTYNFMEQKAIPMDIVEKAILIGFDYAKYAHENGYDIIGNGEIGMGNTTTATACIMAALGTDDISLVGRGGGLSDQAFIKKQEIIVKAIEKYSLKNADPMEILSCVGGLDIAAMVGLYLGAAYYRIPIIVDGVISIAGALLAHKINPLTADFMIASHISEEPSYKRASEVIGLQPMLYLQMRLGEGSGCPVAMDVVKTALFIGSNMSTFADVKLESEYREELTMK